MNAEKVAHAKRAGVVLRMAAAALRGEDDMDVLAIASSDEVFELERITMVAVSLVGTLMQALTEGHESTCADCIADELDVIGSLIAGGHPAALSKLGLL